MLAKFADHVSKTLEEIKAQGLFKTERIITGPQNAEIPIADGRRVINLCANNYLGLADHPALIAAAKEALDSHGFGMASVRFICGTQDIHKELEGALARFLGTEDTILYPSCFDANGGLFETLLGAEDAVISDELNHASIIDGVRLCKAQRYRYKNNDMADLEAQACRQPKRPRFRMIATDGVFSMDGTIANLQRHLRSGGKIRRAGDGRRFARRRLHGQNRPRHARTLRRAWTASTSSPARSAKRSAARAAATPAAGRRSSNCCASVRGRISSPTRSRRRSSRRRSKRSSFSAARPNCATSWRKTRDSSARQ